ncbi:hypothetical protein HBH61_097860 [Parastagonospora nodorum]|nr:hypothetical protein HBH61_097860 [Parastagonospora nodorum]
MTLISDEYETLYAEVEREMRERAILSRVVALRQNSLLQSTALDSRLRIITHLARRKMRCNYNPETGLRNNDGYAEAVVYSAGQSNTCTRTGSDPYTNGLTAFIRTLEREVGFEDKRSGIYYYTKIADGWTCIRISTEARWHGALQDTVVTKLYRATFVIELLI